MLRVQADTLELCAKSWQFLVDNCDRLINRLLLENTGFTWIRFDGDAHSRFTLTWPLPSIGIAPWSLSAMKTLPALQRTPCFANRCALFATEI